jgi:N-acetylmuramoyl-L-alanine amidase
MICVASRPDMVGVSRVVQAFAFSAAFLFHSPPLALAYEVDGEFGYVDPDPAGVVADPATPDKRQPLEDRLQKFDLALDRLGIPRERTPGFDDFPLPGSVALKDVKPHLPVIDPDGALQRYLRISDSGISLFRDFFSAITPSSFLEYFFTLAGANAKYAAPSDSGMLIQRLRQIGSQVRQGLFETPLRGLRVVIDPGHMGNEEWDHKTGKFVAVGGKTVSEGEIALSTALLLAGELEDLGAEVTLTRTKGGPVARTTPESFDPSPHLNQYFYNSLDSWMSGYFQLPANRFLSAVLEAPETRRAFDPAQRTQFFISGEDLEARARIVDEARADLVIDVHFDASKSNELQSSSRSIEAFVPGGVRLGETGSRVVRSHHLKHLLEVRRWRESVNLASSMIESMAESLDLPLLTRPEFLTSVKVKDGVYARNLYINRRNLGALMVYLECLHYDHVREFPGLAYKDRTGTYHGETFHYPKRLEAVVAGAKEGILRYFRTVE